MRRIDDMPQDRSKKYPWDTLMDGTAWLVDPEKEFGVSADTFRNSVYRRAYRTGTKAHTSLVGDGLVAVQFEGGEG